MKKVYLLPCLVIALMFLACGSLSAQKDKDIVKAAKLMFERKASDSAFFYVLTAKKVKSGKVQDVLKKAYPALISKHMRETNAIKIGDKEDNKVKVEKIQQMIVIMKESSLADSMLNLSVKPDVYKQLSKKRSIDKSLSSYDKRMEAVKLEIIKQERIIRVNDSLAYVDSVRTVHIEDSIRMAARADSARISDSIAAAALSKTQKKEIAAEKIKLVPTAVDDGTKRYYIIAGAFKTPEDAQKAADKLNAQGFRSEIVNINPWGNYRICFNSYDTYAAARAELDGIREKYRPDAWILAK